MLDENLDTEDIRILIHPFTLALIPMKSGLDSGELNFSFYSPREKMGQCAVTKISVLLHGKIIHARLV